jgi:hypothetical protein
MQMFNRLTNQKNLIRCMSTNTMKYKYNMNTKDVLVSDKGGWPLLAIMSSAFIFSSSFLVYKFRSCSDVRFYKDKRQMLFRD